MKKYLFIVSVLQFIIFGTSAQDQLKLPSKPLIEMSVDMPDETQETDIMETGQFQVETAYLHNLYKEGRHSSIFQGLIRYGLSKRVELRLLVETGSQLQRYMDETVQSTFPVAASAKILILKDYKQLPDISVVSYLQLPLYKTSSNTKAYWSPIILVAFQNEFGKKWKLEYNVGAQQEAYSTHWTWIGNASIHYKVFDQLEVFSEYFAQYQSAKSPQHNIGCGIGYQLNNYVAIFGMAGSTINFAESNHFYNSGLAFRMP